MTQLRGQQATSRSSLESITRAGQATQYPLGPEADLHKIGVGGSNGTGGQYKQGNVQAQGELGFLYAEGRGVDQDQAEAMRWYRLAAEQGDADAQGSLGFMYSEGRGVEQDDVEAVRWYRLAAEQGDAIAQNNLGLMYREGRGVPQNLVRAYMWFSLAAAQGQPLSRDWRDRIANTLTPQQLQEAQALATRCFESGYKDCD